MANSHYERWLVKAPAGIILIAGGLFFMYYSLTQLELKNQWAIYALISAASITFGTVILCSAFINKMKSDIIKKQKAKGGSAEKKTD